MGKHRYIYLEAAERLLLTPIIQPGKATARVQTRARILLLSDRNQERIHTIAEVAAGASCSIGTIRNVKRNYFAGGVEAALYTQTRPGVRPTFTGETVIQLTRLAGSQPPPGHVRWTLRLLANQMVELAYVEAISHVTVGEILKKHKHCI